MSGQPTPQPLRLSVLHRGPNPPGAECETVLSVRWGSLAELWLRCREVVELLSTIEAVASSGVLLAVGGLNGRVFRPLPGSLEELLEASTRELVLGPGERIVVLPHVETSRAVEALAPYSARVSLRPRSRRLSVVLSKPLGTGYLFDNRVRLLKPVAVPPVPTRGPGPRSR